MKIQKFKVGSYYLFIDYKGGVQYKSLYGTIFKVIGINNRSYKTNNVDILDIGLNSLFMKNIVVKEVTKETHPEYFL